MKPRRPAAEIAAELLARHGLSRDRKTSPPKAIRSTPEDREALNILRSCGPTHLPQRTHKDYAHTEVRT